MKFFENRFSSAQGVQITIVYPDFCAASGDSRDHAMVGHLHEPEHRFYVFYTTRSCANSL